jgi:hypothetical protein
MRAAYVVLALLVGAAPCFAQESPVVDPTPVASDHELLHKYVWATLGIEGALHATLASGFEKWGNSPPGDWGTGTREYGRRWASEYAESAISNTATYAVARIFHHDPSFTRCECSGVARRLLHAVGAPFLARKRDGTRVLSAASVAGSLAGHVVSANTWYPAPLGTRDGLKYAATSLASQIGGNVFQEFGPHRSK